MTIEIPILDGEDWWASEAIDDTDSVIKSLLNLTKSCIKLNIRLAESMQLHAELSLYNATHNIELETDKWLTFCASLRDTEISKVADNVQNNLNAYVSKHLKNRD
jgi:hypothetical protein